jgi:flagellar assembly protein FliH
MTAIFQRNFDHEADMDARGTGGLLSEAALQEIRDAAFEAGRAQGEQEAKTRMRGAAETLRAQALTRIGEGVARLLSDREEQERSLEAQLLDYAIAIGEKVLPDLIETRSHQHVISQIRKSVRMGLGSSRVRIRLSGQDLDLVGSDPEALGIAPEHAARVALVACDRLKPGDLEIDWDQGGLSYSFSAICEEVLTLLRKSNPSPGHSGMGASSTNKKGDTP